MCRWRILVVKFCEYHFFVLEMVGKECEEMAENLFFSGFIGQTSEAVESFFVLEFCCDRAVAYQWVQLDGADILPGMSKNLTKME